MPRPIIDYGPFMEQIATWLHEGFSNAHIVEELHHGGLPNATLRTLKRRLASHEIIRRESAGPNSNQINYGSFMPSIIRWVQLGLTDAEIVAALSQSGFPQASERTLQRRLRIEGISRRVYITDRWEVRLEIATLWAKQFSDIEIVQMFQDCNIPIALRTVQRLRRSMGCVNRMTKEDRLQADQELKMLMEKSMNAGECVSFGRTLMMSFLREKGYFTAVK